METENSKETIATTADNLAVYEVSYLLLPSLALEQVPHEVDSIKESITSRAGAVISQEMPVLIDLAYPLTKVVQTVRHKVTTGYFGWVKFEMPHDGVLGVKKVLDGDDTIIRYLIIKTVRENTLLNGKMMLKKEEKMKREDDEFLDSSEGEGGKVQAPTETVPEELDKSIDDLVIA